MILDLTVEETDDKKIAVWFVLRARDSTSVFIEWLESNCVHHYKWKSVPGSATRRCTFDSRMDATNFVTHLMKAS